MRGRVAHCNRLITGGGEHVARGADKHGPQWGASSASGGGPRFGKRHFHKPNIVRFCHIGPSLAPRAARWPDALIPAFTGPRDTRRCKENLVDTARFIPFRRPGRPLLMRRAFFWTIVATTFLTNGIALTRAASSAGISLHFTRRESSLSQARRACAYDFAAFDAALKALAPIEQAGMMWQYPPAMYFLVAPFALLPYKLAFIAWIVGWVVCTRMVVASDRVSRSAFSHSSFFIACGFDPELWPDQRGDGGPSLSRRLRSERTMACRRASPQDANAETATGPAPAICVSRCGRVAHDRHRVCDGGHTPRAVLFLPSALTGGQPSSMRSCAFATRSPAPRR